MPLFTLRFIYASERSTSNMGGVVRVLLVAVIYWVSLGIVRAFVLQTKTIPDLAWVPCILAAVYLLWDHLAAARSRA